MSWIQKTNPLVADDDGSPSGGEGDQGDESQLQSYDALWGVDDLRCLFWGFFFKPTSYHVSNVSNGFGTMLSENLTVGWCRGTFEAISNADG